MKFATPLTALALFVTRRIGSADAAGTTGTGGGLIESEVGFGWNEKVRGYIYVGVGDVSQRAAFVPFFVSVRCKSISTQLLDF